MPVSGRNVPVPAVASGGTTDTDWVPETGNEDSEAPVNVLVTPNPDIQNEPAVGVHLLDPRIMVAGANDYRATGDAQIGIYRSTDGGFRWTNTIPPLPPGHVNSGDPVVAYGYPDRFLVGGAAYKAPLEQAGASIIAYLSEDAGETFEGPIIVQEGFGRQGFNDKPWFTIDTAPASPFQGRAYVAYTRFMTPDTIVFFQRSEDGGRTWSEPIPLTGIEPFSLGTFVAVGREGEVYVAWVAYDEQASLVFRRSLDGGRTFERPVTIARFPVPEIEQGLSRFVPEFTFRVYTFAFLGVDTTTGPDGGTIYAVWHQIRRSTQHGKVLETVDVMISISRDRGLTWSRPRKVTDTPSRALSFNPFISVTPETGTVNIVYYTNRLVRDELDVFLVRIEDHGQRFLPDERVTNRSFDPNDAPLGDAFIGDYIGVAAIPDTDRAVAVWTDTRRGNQDIFGAPDA